MLTVVLDTNIFISAFLTPRGEGAETVRRAQGELLYLSPFIFFEIESNLRSPRLRKRFRYTIPDVKKYVRNLYRASRVINPTQIPQVCPDQDDNRVLACAVEAQAEYLVTRNTKHFPRSYAGVTVITPKEFLLIVKP